MAEKSLTEIPRAWRDQYEKGLAAMHKDNLDYALALFDQVLVAEPGFYLCREALRATQFKRTSGETGLFKRFLGAAGSSPHLAKGQLALRTNPLEALRHAEQALNGDPHNQTAHRLLAEAAMAADLPRTAALSLEILHKQDPRDRTVGTQLSEALARSGEIQKAEAVLAELLEAHPNDPDVAQALKNISAQRTMNEGGYERLEGGEGSYRDILKDAQQAKSLEAEQRSVRPGDGPSDLIADYEARVAHEPDNLRTLRRLAELYADHQDYDRALERYHQLAERQGPGDPSLDKLIAELTVRKYDAALAAVDPHSDGVEATVARLKQERADFLIADCRKRLERYPTELSIRYELGEMLFQAGRFADAIPEFQKAQNHPPKRIAAMHHLGRCFSARGMFDLAVRSFENALKEKPTFDDEKKDLLYDLGTALARQGKADAAIEQFKAVYEADVGYRDVSAKVEAHYAAKAAQQ
jgi:tetratricopeptide (TPR) repeat protein